MLHTVNRLAAKFVASVAGVIGATAFVSSNTWYGFALILLGPVLAVLVHELGHAGAAHALGMNVRTIAVGPFELRTRPLRFGFAQRFLGRDVGGHVEFDDTSGHWLTRQKHILIIIAGPLANLASFALALVVANFFAAGSAGLINAGFGFTSLAAFIASAWPFRIVSGRGNDAFSLLGALDLKPLFTLRRKPKRSSWQAR